MDADLDAEVAGLAGQHKQPQTPLPSMSGVKTNSQVLFKPIFPAYATLALQTTFSSNYAGRCSHGFPTSSEVCAFVWGIFVRGLRVETFVRVLRSSRVNLTKCK